MSRSAYCKAGAVFTCGDTHGSIVHNGTNLTIEYNDVQYESNRFVFSYTANGNVHTSSDSDDVDADRKSVV